MKIKAKLFNLNVFLYKYYRYILLTLVILLISFCISVSSNLDSHFRYMEYIVDNNIFEYQEVDLEHICSLTHCNEIILKNKHNFSVFKKENFLIFVRNQNKINFLKFSDDVYYYKLKLYIYNSKAKAFISINYLEKIKEMINEFIILFFFILIGTVYLLFSTFKQEQKEAMFHSVGNEAILANKSIVMITENIHHEMNTPLDIIDNKMQKICKRIKEYNNKIENDRRKYDKLLKLDKDFDFIKISIEQMYGVLSKMKNFKSLKYSNGNKTFYDIIDGAFRIIAVSNAGFNYNIDILFKKYKMSTSNIKNIDLLNVLINHIKNSLEANSTFIEVYPEFNNITHDLKIIIKDNGSGIPPDVRKYIFEPNFSTKTISESIRGNGMYLNKYIIQETGGDIYIKNSNTRGTEIVIKIPAKEIK